MPRKVPRPNPKKVKSKGNRHGGAGCLGLPTGAGMPLPVWKPDQRHPLAKQLKQEGQGPRGGALGAAGGPKRGASAPHWPTLASLVRHGATGDNAASDSGAPQRTLDPYPRCSLIPTPLLSPPKGFIFPFLFFLTNSQENLGQLCSPPCRHHPHSFGVTYPCLTPRSLRTWGSRVGRTGLDWNPSTSSPAVRQDHFICPFPYSKMCIAIPKTTHSEE